MRICLIHSFSSLYNYVNFSNMTILRWDVQVIGSIFMCFGLCTVNAAQTSGKNPPEIIELFGGKHKTQDVHNSSLPSGIIHNENKIFTEGSTSSLSVPNQGTANTTHANINEPHQVKTETLTTANNIKLSDEAGSSITPHILNETTLDFIYGVGDHANVISSASKPRKIVPKKGVNINDYFNYTFPSDHVCFYMRQNICYDINNYKDIKCTCCKVSNNIGIIISRQPSINCSICSQVNIYSQPCDGICCKNISLPTSYADKEKINGSDNSKKSEALESSSLKPVNKSNYIKKLKLKPTVTYVSHNSGTTNPFSKSKGEKYVPIIVSIFILPLVGIFVFFIWKKTREVWDRRYYKRMDFLIDGMYNE